MARRASDGGTAGQAEIIVRAIAAIRLLARPGQHTIPELADKLGVSTRQAYRYIDALDEAGIHVEHEKRTPHYLIRAAVVRKVFSV